MTDTAPQYTPQQRNGRQLFVLSLTFLGAIPLWSIFIMGGNPAVMIGFIVAYTAIFAFAYGGGQIAGGLIKGFTLLLTLFSTVLLLALAMVHFGDSGKTIERPLWEIIAPPLICYFAVWSLFLSGSVRAFLKVQQERREARLSSSTHP